MVCCIVCFCRACTAFCLAAFLLCYLKKESSSAQFDVFEPKERCLKGNFEIASEELSEPSTQRTKTTTEEFTFEICSFWQMGKKFSMGRSWGGGDALSSLLSKVMSPTAVSPPDLSLCQRNSFFVLENMSLGRGEGKSQCLSPFWRQ